MSPISRKTLDWLLLVAIDLTVPVVAIWKYHAGQATISVAIISAFASLVILNTVFVRSIYNRNKKSGGQSIFRGLITGAVGLAVLSGALTMAGLHLISYRNDYVDLALSNVPLEQIHPEQKALVVELVRRRAALRRDYVDQAAQANPISPPIYSADSFGNEHVIRLVSDQYKKANSLDFAYQEQLDQSMNDFRNKMAKVDPDYLRSFEAGQQEQEKQDAQVEQLERECFAATAALYDYADAHSKNIVVKDGQLHFTNDSVQAEFSIQLEKSKALYGEWQKARQVLVTRQQQSRKAVGLGPNP